MHDVDYGFTQPLTRTGTIPAEWKCRCTQGRTIVIKYDSGFFSVRRSLFKDASLEDARTGTVLLSEQLSEDINSSYMATVDMLLYLNYFGWIHISFWRKLLVAIFGNVYRKQEKQLLHANLLDETFKQLIEIEETPTDENTERNSEED